MSRYDNIYECDQYKVTHDNNQKTFWIWDKSQKWNAAMKAKTELDAYKEALKTAMTWQANYRKQYEEENAKIHSVLNALNAEIIEDIYE